MISNPSRQPSPLPSRKQFEGAPFFQVIERVSDGFCVLDPEWNFTFLSPKLLSLLKLEGDFTRQHIWSTFELLATTGFYDAAMKAHQSASFESQTEQCPYTNLWLESTFIPCADGLVIYLRDVTEQQHSRDEQSRFVAILEATTDFVCISDTKGKPTYLNHAGRRLLGLASDEAVSHYKFHPEWATSLILTTGIPIAMKEGVWTGETALLTKDGREIPVSQVIIAHKNNHGEVEFISTIARDLTDRIRSENQLRERAALLDQAPDAICVCDLDGKILYWNKGAERIYGWSAAEAVGQKMIELIGRAGEENQTATIFSELLTTGEWRKECRQLTKSGKEIISSCHWSLVKEDSGAKRTILIINTDITERKKLEEQFLRTQRLEGIGTLANGIAHDLNNVLSPILLATRILSLKFQDDDSQQLLSTLRRSAERGADLVRQVLTYVRGAEGERILIQPQYSINEVVRILRETLPKTIAVQVDIAPDLCPILGDSTQLHQVVMNLCLNARDAMPRGGTLKISARNVTANELPEPVLRATSHWIELTVSDTGIGIPTDLQDKIFEPFFTTKSHGQGSGLGLSTVMGIVKSHQGYIDCQSQANVGTTFTIYFPAELNQTPIEPVRAQVDVQRGKGECVLLVDDEADILQLTSETLHSYGFRTICANGGAEAVAILQHAQVKIDLALIDMMMPKMDGLETIQALRQINPALCIISTSGLSDPDRINSAFSLGAGAFLQKPCHPTNLVQTIIQVLSESGQSAA